MKVTREDVAKRAGVSTATVSNVLNNPDKVKPETAERVREVVKILNYHPNMIARSMTTQKSMQLGIVLESLSNPFFGDIVRGFENAANEKNYFVNICTGFNKLDDYFDNFITRRVDGVFVAAIPNKFNVEKIYNLVENGIKIIVSGNVCADFRKVSSIEMDYIGAMKQVMEYLYSLGHRKIAYLSGLGRNAVYDLRVKGYLDMIQKLGLPYGDELLIEGRKPYLTGMAEGYKYAVQLLESDREFSAVVCVNDLMALGAMKALKEHGLRIPEDISVVGFDGIEFGKYWEPELTTMSMDKEEFGKKAFEMLFSNITQGCTSYHECTMELTIRGSTSLCDK